MENLLEGKMVLGIGDKVFNSLKFVKTTKQTDEFYDSLNGTNIGENNEK